MERAREQHKPVRRPISARAHRRTCALIGPRASWRASCPPPPSLGLFPMSRSFAMPLIAATSLGLVAAQSADGQVNLAPATVTYIRGVPDRGPGGELLLSESEGPKPRDFFQGTGFSGAVGKNGQLAVSTKALRVGVYGTPNCKTVNDVDTCTVRIVYQFDLESQIVDAVDRSTAALKQYVLSDRGSPLTLKLPAKGVPGLGWTTFNTRKGAVEQQPWSAGALAATLRYIPVRNQNNAISSGANFTAQYTFEQHLWANVGGVDGTAYFVLTPSINVLVGTELRTQVSEVGSHLSTIMGLSYQAGYQFGTSNAVSVSGTYSFAAMRDGRRQISVGLTRVLGALGAGR